MDGEKLNMACPRVSVCVEISDVSSYVIGR
jgi:hypothetical protein